MKGNDKMTKKQKSILDMTDLQLAKTIFAVGTKAAQKAVPYRKWQKWKELSHANVQAHLAVAVWIKKQVKP
jgi:hypothetical protein